MILWNRVEYSYNATFQGDWNEQTDLVSYISLRGRHSNGKGKGILDAWEEKEGKACKEAIVFAIPPKLCMQK